MESELVDVKPMEQTPTGDTVVVLTFSPIIGFWSSDPSPPCNEKIAVQSVKNTH